MEEARIPKYAFLGGKIVNWENANVHLSTHALHYGTGVFGGIRGYWNENKKQIFIFRIDDHINRLFDSCRIMYIKPNYTKDEVKKIILELVSKNGFKEDVYIRPIFFKSKSQKIVGMDITKVSDEFGLFAIGFGEYLDKKDGLHVCTSTWRRLPDTCIPPLGKICGTYANSTLAKAEATMNNFDDAIFLNEDGTVCEGTAMNIFIVRNGALITPPIHANILEGITRDTIMKIAGEIGVKVIERKIQRTELYIMDEAFFCGTGVQIAPIVKVDNREIKNKDMPITKKLREKFFRIVRGEEERHKNWLTGVY